MASTRLLPQHFVEHLVQAFGSLPKRVPHSLALLRVALGFDAVGQVELGRLRPDVPDFFVRERLGQLAKMFGQPQVSWLSLDPLAAWASATSRACTRAIADWAER
jgi:hypothetical protein